MRGPGVITWDEARLTLQVMAEERTGWLVRERLYAARAQEDATWAAATAAAS